MNLQVTFKNGFQTVRDICSDSYKFSIFCLQRDYKQPKLKRRFMLSEYYIRENLKNADKTPPYVIGMDKSGKLWLYEIEFSEYGYVYLKKVGEWEYNEKMGSKKKGWRVIEREDLKKYVDVVAKNWDVSEIIIV